METQKPDNVMLTERDKYHEKLMVNILKNLSDTPLVLKGGTALYLGYGLNRFSEDLDFDSSKKLNLLNKIKASAPQGIVIDNKLHAAYDGDNTRTKGRDLFDLHFLARHYSKHFDFELTTRLKGFAQDPDKLVSLYREDIEADPLLNKIMDVEQIALELNEIAEYLFHSRDSART